MSEQLQLANIRNVLIRIEETIIFALIERAQFRRNARIYEPGAFGPVLGGLSLVGYCLRETECVHARMRRYTSPDEHPFFRDLPAPVLPPLVYRHNPLRPNSVNINAHILDAYANGMVPLVCADGDDEQYGSSSVCDVTCLQAISHRVHYGMFVAESKYRAKPADFERLVQAGDRAALLEAITDPGVEADVLKRVAKKSESYSRELKTSSAGQPFDSGKVVDIYRRWIIPLNKRVQVEYLMDAALSPGPRPGSSSS